jgi:hypothetical protein
LTAKWKATRVLGAGGYGICALFERLPDDEDLVEEDEGRSEPQPERINHIVVKQSAGDHAVNLGRESKVLYELGKRNTEQ